MRAGLLLVGLAAILLATAPAKAQTITAAEYAGKTQAYPHGVLGDDDEWDRVRITVTRSKGDEGSLLSGHINLTYEVAALPQTVFEDIAPRLWDVTGDGAPEVVVIQSHAQQGARLLIIGLVDGSLEYIGATPYIGQRFRWLAPIGAADLDGDGNIEIAYVDRPHLAKTLRIWRYADGTFSSVASLQGVSNHRIGEPFISGGIRDCGEGPELILADADWQNIMAARLTLTRFFATPIAPFSGADSMARALNCE